MGKRIYYCNNVGHETWNADFLEFLNQYKNPDTEITVGSLSPGLPTNNEYGYFRMLTGEETIHSLLRAEREGYDAAIIGCFCDPWLEAAREILSRMVVVGPCESSCHILAPIAGSFSVVTVRRKEILMMKERIVGYGFGEQLASMRQLNIAVCDLDKDRAYTRRRIREEIRAAVEEDGAEGIILGCTCETGCFAALQEEFNVPVIDATIAPLKYAEFLCDVRDRAGWYTSKIGKYEPPSKEEIISTGVAKHFSAEDIWK